MPSDVAYVGHAFSSMFDAWPTFAPYFTAHAVERTSLLR